MGCASPRINAALATWSISFSFVPPIRDRSIRIPAPLASLAVVSETGALHSIADRVGIRTRGNRLFILPGKKGRPTRIVGSEDVLRPKLPVFHTWTMRSNIWPISSLLVGRPYHFVPMQAI